MQAVVQSLEWPELQTEFVVDAYNAFLMMHQQTIRINLWIYYTDMCCVCYDLHDCVDLVRMWLVFETRGGEAE
jgi:hypothetical protein